MPGRTRIWALGGDSLCAPEDTFPAYWGALGAGADGLAIGVQLTADRELVCCARSSLIDTCGDERTVNDLSWSELRGLDAGTVYRSTDLDQDLQPSGRGNDTPWEGASRRQAPLYHPRLWEVLLHLNHRTDLLVMPVAPAGSNDEHRNHLVDAVLSTLGRFGVTDRALVAADANLLSRFREASECTPRILMASDEMDLDNACNAAEAVGAETLLIDVERLISPGATSVTSVPLTDSGQMTMIVTSHTMPYVLRPAILTAVAGTTAVTGILCRGVRETVSVQCPSHLVAEDDFAGNRFDRDLWRAGYSKANQDTRLIHDDGLTIDIQEGGKYSGGAALTAYSIHGCFDARVDFEVANPDQGTTFEVAAIQVDPGYHHPDNNDLSRRSVNLTFDVHGAPPYASSERDEDDGFRIGWNNGPAVTDFVNHNAQSSNIYNKYSRDVGDASADNPTGSLRLVRCGDIFNAYYRDRHNRGWVLSGSVAVPTLCQDVYLRLGAKHWPKRGRTPPGNRITFSRFRLYQW